MSKCKKNSVRGSKQQGRKVAFTEVKVFLIRIFDTIDNFQAVSLCWLILEFSPKKVVTPTLALHQKTWPSH